MYRPDRQNRQQLFQGILLKVTIQNFKESACKSYLCIHTIVLIFLDITVCFIRFVFLSFICEFKGLCKNKLIVLDFAMYA